MTRSTSATKLPWGQGPAEFDRLLAVETDECVPWPYGCDGEGYGVLRIKGKQRGVHVLACERTHGPAPFPKAHAAHSCLTKNCLNPRHLSWETASQNAYDRNRDGTMLTGAAVAAHHSKLTPEQVRAIRAQLAEGRRVDAIANRYGVSPGTIYDIGSGRSWAWLK